MSRECMTHDECNEGYYCDPNINMCDTCTTCLRYNNDGFCSQICSGGQMDGLGTTIEPNNNKPLPPDNLINDGTSGKGMNTEIAVACIISGFLALVIVAFLILVIVQKRSRKQKEHIEEGHELNPLQAEQTQHGEIVVPTGNRIDLRTTEL